MPVPETIRIVPDHQVFGTTYHIEHCGRLHDGRQMLAFVTGAFPEGYMFGPDWRSQKRWLAVLHPVPFPMEPK
jgi:hypothetical protein